MKGSKKNGLLFWSVYMMILFFLPEKSTGFFLLAGIIVLGIMIIYYCLLPSALPCYLELPACCRKM